MSRVENQRPTVKEAVFTFGVLNNRVFSKGSKGQIERPKLYGITCCLGKFRDNFDSNVFQEIFTFVPPPHKHEDQPRLDKNCLGATSNLSPGVFVQC